MLQEIRKYQKNTLNASKYRQYIMTFTKKIPDKTQTVNNNKTSCSNEPLIVTPQIHGKVKTTI